MSEYELRDGEKVVRPTDEKHPVNQTRPVRVSSSAYELLEDYRMAVLEFAAATGAKGVEQKYVNMEMRRRELSVYLSNIEKYFGTEQPVVLKF